MTASGSETDSIRIRFTVPDMPGKAPATERQKEAVKSVLTDAIDPEGLTAGQASLILDVNSYVNGMLDFAIKSGMYHGDDVDSLIIFKLVAIEAIKGDEKLWRGIHQWGRVMYSSGRDTRSPELNPSSKLFQTVFRAFTNHIRNRTW